MKPIDRPANRGVKNSAILDLDIFTLVLTCNARLSKIDLNMFRQYQAVRLSNNKQGQQGPQT